MIPRYGIDIGATSIKGTAIDEAGKELASYTVMAPSAGKAMDIEDAIVECQAAIAAAVPGGRRIGLGAPGWVSADRNTVHYSPNLPWRDEPLGDRIRARTGLPTVVENDANAAAWGEYRFGAGRSASSLVAITLGSGVGGALVVDGRLLRGHHGGAGEIGHFSSVVADGTLCACGRVGCLENYVSGRAIERRGIFHTHGVPDATRYEDPWEERGLRQFGDELGAGIAQATLLFNPEVVVICGGVANSFERFAEQTLVAIRRELRSWRRLCPTLKVAELGQGAGRIGAADLSTYDAGGQQHAPDVTVLED